VSYVFGAVCFFFFYVFGVAACAGVNIGVIGARNGIPSSNGVFNAWRVQM